MEPTVSIVIPVFNKLELTKHCLDALARTAAECEIVVVDNASSDGTAEYLASLASRVRVISNDQNLGFAKACNQAAIAATGEILVLLNNDTVPLPGWLQPLVEELQRPGAGIVGSKLLYPDGTVQHAGVIISTDPVYPFSAHHLYKGAASEAPFVNKSQAFQAVTAACMAVRREVYLRLAGMDEAFVNGFEDVDFCLRAGRAGLRVWYAAESVVIHHESKTPGRHAHEDANLDRLMRLWAGRVEPDYERYLLDESLHLAFIGGELLLLDEAEEFYLKVDGDLPLPLPAELLARDSLGYYVPDRDNHLRLRVPATPRRSKEAPVVDNAYVDVAEPFVVSIVIPCWNKSDYTRRCLEALADSIPESLPYEVVLVDNGSSDETPELLASLGGDVQVITNAENRGFAIACNQGAQAARGKYLVLLNNDTEAQEGWLQAMLDVIRGEPDVGIVGAKLLYPDGTIQHAGVVFAARTGIKTIVASDSFVAEENVPHLWPYHLYRRMPERAPFVSSRRDFQAVTGACLLIEKATYDEVGGLDEAYVNSFEDVDLCLKVLASGRRVVYCPEAVVIHHESISEGRHDHDIANGCRLQERWRDFIVGDDEQFLLDDAFVVDRPHPEVSTFYWWGGLAQAGERFSSGRLGEALEVLGRIDAELPDHDGARILRAVLTKRIAHYGRGKNAS